jgi:hypothetical protein
MSLWPLRSLKAEPKSDLSKRIKTNPILQAQLIKELKSVPSLK